MIFIIKKIMEGLNMLKDLFKKTKYGTVLPNNNSGKSLGFNNQDTRAFDKISSEIPDKDDGPAIPDGLWIMCPNCRRPVYKNKLNENKKVCPNCGYYFRMSAKERIELICDENSFIEFNSEMASKNILNFPAYDDKLKQAKGKSGLNESAVTGKCKISGMDSVIAVMDSNFMMGSMGSITGEKIAEAIEKADSDKLPLIIFCASGGARMQEGMLSLMQMAKTSAAIKRFSENGNLYISVLTDPTTGGVTASFAMLGDIIIAEKDALVGFAGRRVIEQTIREQLPSDFQKSNFILQHGFCDIVLDRFAMKETISRILKFHAYSCGDI